MHLQPKGFKDTEGKISDKFTERWSAKIRLHILGK